jgi:ferredoxin-fold anticodon binding domain-containing protein
MNYLDYWDGDYIEIDPVKDLTFKITEYNNKTSDDVREFTGGDTRLSI